MGSFTQYILTQIRLRLRINFFPSFNSSHSQFGEDMILRSLIGNKKNGFFIDIGAHHPYFYSNTFHFYLKGWRGLSIDALPGSMKTFNKLRPQDINVEACIGPKAGEEVTFYEFSKPALNSFDSEYAKKMEASGERIVETHSLKTETLENIIKYKGLEGKEIDFLSIDIEGVDEIVLRSLDFKKVKPKIIVFENHEHNPMNPTHTSMLNYLSKFGYNLVAQTGPSLIVSHS